jgi:hypothetical protein
MTPLPTPINVRPDTPGDLPTDGLFSPSDALLSPVSSALSKIRGKNGASQSRRIHANSPRWSRLSADSVNSRLGVPRSPHAPKHAVQRIVLSPNALEAVPLTVSRARQRGRKME